MSRSAWVGSVRLIGVVYGTIAILGGLASFVLFVRIPPDLLSAVPALGRVVVEVAPWLVAVESGAQSGPGFAVMLLFSAVFLVYGVWALQRALFGDAESFVPDIGAWLN